MENSVDSAYRVKAVALDFDGVITNLDVDWKAAIRQASVIVGYDIKSLLTFYEASQGKPIFHTVSREMEKLELQALKNAQLTPFIEDFLQKICEKQIGMYVVSMQSAQVVKMFLRQHELTGYFRKIITRERCPSKKSQIKHIIEETGIHPSEILLIDDSKRNITSCQELGIMCFHFTRQQEPRKIKDLWSSILNLVKNGPSRT
jgi:beta-phosphoglucomutase-like phosphatase (HAD superfamily)